MARFTVYPALEPEGSFLLDVQADVMRHLNTRLVVPLMPLSKAPTPATRLNPLFTIDGKQYSMVTQYMASIPANELKRAALSLSDRRDEIVAAIDLLLQGF